MKIYENYSLQERHTFHLPVKTRYYIEYDTVNELCAFIKENSLFREYPCYHIGGGSNLLFLQDYRGIILHSAIRFIECVGEDEDTVLLRVGSGVVWDDFVKYCVENNWGCNRKGRNDRYAKWRIPHIYKCRMCVCVS